LRHRTFLPYGFQVKPATLLRSLRRLAKRRGVAYAKAAGKGSHRKVRLGNRVSVVPLHPQDLPTGLFRSVLRQLDVRPDELD
jgi:predicted RNA binding protein YcfA (HicA-like mRNA interferase family)